MRHAVILAGGSGTRLWPLSTKRRPKQFHAFVGGESLIAATARRLRPLVGDRIYVVTSAEQRDLVRDALPGLPEDHIFAEPSARNTGPAIGLATAYLAAIDPDASVAVLPSDHHVRDDVAFTEDCESALQHAEMEPCIAVVGVPPTRAETGYGYLEVTGDGRVGRFAEKPDAKTAQGYLEQGTFLWNAGMFFARAEHLLAEFDARMPKLGALAREIVAACSSGGRRAGDAVAAERYPGLDSISFDYGIMEKTEAVIAVRARFDWSDLGDWAALAELSEQDAAGNTSVGQVVSTNARDNILYSSDGTLLAVDGVSDLIVVATGNTVMVTRRDRAQNVREVVSAVRDQGHDDRL